MHEVRHTEIFYMERQLKGLNEQLNSGTLSPSERKQLDARIQLLTQILEAYRDKPKPPSRNTPQRRPCRKNHKRP